MRPLIIVSIVATLFGCRQESPNHADEILTEINVDFEDPLVRKIIEHQDRLATDSLLPYFRYRDPTYRYLASRAFASLQSPHHLDTLIGLLSDPVARVRQAAAYALGQTGSADAEAPLIDAFQNHDTLDVNTTLNATILEAIGKCGSSKSLEQLSQVTTYQIHDDQLIRGQARAIYRFMQRGVVHKNGTQHMINLLSETSIRQDVRLLAADYLARSAIDLTEYAEIISLIYSNEQDAEILLILPQVLVKSNSQDAPSLLRASLRSVETDYRIKCNVIRAMAASNYRLYRKDIHRHLYDPTPALALIAAESIVSHGSSAFWREYMNLSLDDFPWPVKIKLLHAVNKFIPAGNNMFREINDQKLQQRVRNTKNEYERAAAILALAENANWYRYIIQLSHQESSMLVKTACTEALMKIAQDSRFPRYRQSLRREVIAELIVAVQSGDVGRVSIASQIFSIDGIDLTSYGYPDLVMLINESTKKLKLPADIEAHIALQQQKGKLLGTDYDPENDIILTHQIDWSLLEQISDTTKVLIRTNQGDIQVRLMPGLAPATVANFVDLVNLNYYAGKPFHRVVPVFVIQGGCNRGDGYGSLDYNIRSELNQVYYDKAGYLGMASAGNHTESAQWFITHRATPHLDGRYTIFAEVISGMEVVHRIEIGDHIEQISIY